MSGPVGSRYEPVAVSAEGTVVAEFTVEALAAPAYQSEADLEREFIALLRGQAYDFLTIRSEADLLANLRVQLEALNYVTFTEGEWAGWSPSTSRPRTTAPSTRPCASSRATSTPCRGMTVRSRTSP